MGRFSGMPAPQHLPGRGRAASGILARKGGMGNPSILAPHFPMFHMKPGKWPREGRGLGYVPSAIGRPWPIVPLSPPIPARKETHHDPQSSIQRRLRCLPCWPRSLRLPRGDGRCVADRMAQGVGLLPAGHALSAGSAGLPTPLPHVPDLGPPADRGLGAYP